MHFPSLSDGTFRHRNGHVVLADQNRHPRDTGLGAGWIRDAESIRIISGSGMMVGEDHFMSFSLICNSEGISKFKDFTTKGKNSPEYEPRDKRRSGKRDNVLLTCLTPWVQLGVWPGPPSWNPVFC